MSYITVSNAMKVLASINFDACKELVGDPYKKPIYFFNKREIQLLLGLKELYRDPEYFVLEYYRPIVTEDKYVYVYEGIQPAYHAGNECERLHSNFKNFKIPESIKQNGQQAVIEFREWFKKHQKEFYEKPDVFEALFYSKFGFKAEKVDYENSGIEEKENLDLTELEQRINGILTEAGRFFRECDAVHQNIIRRFGKMTFWAYINKEIYSNDTEIGDDDLKAFLRGYDIQFKKPIKMLLKEYYRELYNPEKKFEGQLLEALGFRPCGACHGNHSDVFAEIPEIKITTPYVDDDLPW